MNDYFTDSAVYNTDVDYTWRDAARWTLEGAAVLEPLEGRLLDDLLGLARLSFQFCDVERATFRADGVTPETDGEHTVSLGLVACAFAAEHHPNLDTAKIAEFALVHDLVEVYAGDTPALRINEAQLGYKELADLDAQFAEKLPWVPAMIRRYETLHDPEARFVKAMDKLMPKFTHISNCGQALKNADMGLDEFETVMEIQTQAMMEYADDFPALMQLREELLQRIREVVYDV